MRIRVVASPSVATVLFLLALPPAGALAQLPKAGVVTTLEGQALVRRADLPRPAPLKFKDDVFVQDRIDTGERSVVRLLLAGKALLTIRELSIFTVTEEPSRAIVELQSGKLALGVAKKLMRPGDAIEIRTPNAVVGVRGSFVVTEVRVVGGVPQTSVIALEATVPITIAPRTQPAAAVALGPNQRVDVSGMGTAITVGRVQAISAADAREAARTADAPRPLEQSERAPESMVRRLAGERVREAAALATLLTPGGTPAPRTAASPAATGTPTRDESLTQASTGLVQTRLGGPLPPAAALQAGGARIATDIASRNVSDAIANEPEILHLPSDTSGGVILTPGGVPELRLANASRVLGGAEYLLLYPAPPGGQAQRTATTPDVVIDHSLVSQTGGGALLRTGVDLGGIDFGGPLLSVVNGSHLSTEGPLLAGPGAGLVTPIVAGSGPFVALGGGSTLTLGGPILSADGLTVRGDFLRLSDGSTLTLTGGGPLLRTIQGFSVSGALVVVEGGAQLQVLGLPAPLVSIGSRGASIGFGSDQYVFDIAGRATSASTEVVDGVTVTLGTDRPLVHAGSFLEVAGGPASVDVQGAVRIDTALLEASAPLIDVQAVGAIVTTARAAVDLVGRARITSLGPVVRIDGGTLRVTNAALVSVANGSVLHVTGDLVALSNAALTIQNGPILNVSGGSVVNISGALVSLSGSGSVIAVSNALCPCTLFGSIPVALLNGAQAGDVVLGPNPIKNVTSGTVRLSNPTTAPGGTAVIVVNGPGNRVAIGGK